MKKQLVFIGAILLLLPFFISAATPATESFGAEEIKSFSADIVVQENGKFLVRETIVYDFGYSYKHGIFRNIALKDVLDVKVQKITDEKGDSDVYPFQVSRSGGYVKIKIGDPDKTITGVHTYNIFYEVTGGLRFFKDQDELYWNVTGLDWPAPIEKASAKISLPKPVSGIESGLKMACFTGAFGSKESDCGFQADKDNITFQSNRSLSYREGLTIVLGWPKGLVKEPGWPEMLFYRLKFFWPLFVPVIVLIYLFLEWWKKGRDFPLNKAVIAQYEPPDNLRPAQAAAILRQSIKPDDVSAIIVDLAVRGYLSIKEVEEKGIIPVLNKKDYELVKAKDYETDQNISKYEKTILRAFFPLETSKLTRISTHKENFYGYFSSVKSKILEELSGLNYFVSNPESIRKTFLARGILIIFGSLALIYFSNFFSGFVSNIFLVFAAAILSGVLFLIFSFFMPKRTKKGAEAYWKILGFKEYINTAEKYRIQFQEKENIFEKYLPYAIVFGCVDKWAKAFEGIYKTPPSWYQGHYVGAFSAVSFTNSFNNALSNMNSMAAGPRGGGGGSGFGGGGFSGGGGGGGGGGSW